MGVRVTGVQANVPNDPCALTEAGNRDEPEEGGQ